MSKRVTIMLDDDNDKALRRLQANMIRNSSRSVSFSNVMNQVLAKALGKK